MFLISFIRKLNHQILTDEKPRLLKILEKLTSMKTQPAKRKANKMKNHICVQFGKKKERKCVNHDRDVSNSSTD